MFRFKIMDYAPIIKSLSYIINKFWSEEINNHSCFFSPCPFIYHYH